MNMDMTRKEREDEFIIRKELKERRRKGESNLVVRHGNIVGKEDAAP